ncbi:hypothetical protein [Paraburkholderia kururiensis]|uniref:Uncharacterized protein n=1 Tax=Paraburkholderia kururiensis TaxID=984307 RepID=A0ABZ0WSD5_9BURK|nr:hypothetical protein [Paraburkholderia kururiensis]WQD80287.1 hypothetical protein U0042_11720 [Paraburkholderia kururiensis]
MLAAAVATLIGALPGAAHAQAPAHPPAAAPSAPMVKPPQATSDAVNADNPDNMPVKRPRKPVNEGMARRPPASGGTAK